MKALKFCIRVLIVLILIPFFILYRLIIVLFFCVCVIFLLPHILSYLIKCLLNWSKDIKNEKGVVESFFKLFFQNSISDYLNSAKEFILNKQTS